MATIVSRPMTGPLAPFAEGYIAQLRNKGYSVPAISAHRGLVGHLNRWLAESGLSVLELTPPVAQKFLRARREVGYVTKLSDRGLKPLLSYLRELGELSEPSVTRSPSEELVDLFRRYQLEERGLASEVVTNYEHLARLFLSTRSEPIRASLAGLSAAEISAFVLDQCGKRSPESAHNVISGLRALLKFLHVEGLTHRDLASSRGRPATKRRYRPEVGTTAGPATSPTSGPWLTILARG